MPEELIHKSPGAVQFVTSVYEMNTMGWPVTDAEDTQKKNDCTNNKGKLSERKNDAGTATIGYI